jgi:hypothetical protein
MKVSTENDNNFGYEQITIVVDNIPLIKTVPMLVLWCILIKTVTMLESQ